MRPRNKLCTKNKCILRNK